MKKIQWTSLSLTQRKEVLARPFMVNSEMVKEECEKIINNVQENGDKAIFELTETFDQVKLEKLVCYLGEINIDVKLQDAIKMAASNIEKFHCSQIQKNMTVETQPGVVCEKIFRPINSVGLYVPGGTAPLVSTVLMLAIPAKIAGCPIKVLCTPPNNNGQVDPAIQFAGSLCGIEQIYTVGGAQSIAAMAYGTETIPKVDKIFGPGNVWVTQAKQLVSQDPNGAGIDMPAGPSEVMIIADSSSNPIFVAADLLSQAEHGNDSQSILISDNDILIENVFIEIHVQLKNLSRRNIVEKSLENSMAILVDDLKTAIDIANQYAPEHLIIQTENPRQMLEKINCAGSIFLGQWSPESAGDYVSGTNHVLPTYGYARYCSGLSVSDFQIAMSVQELTKKGLENIADSICVLAELEGLDAHKNAVEVRFNYRRENDE